MKRVVKISESQFKKIIGEMAYPQNFSFDEFKNIKSYKRKMEYCNRLLQRISSGSARIAYRVDDEKVLKLAKNQKGIAQNDVETDRHLQTYSIFAKVFDSDSDNYWLEMELAQKVKLSDFKRILGFSFQAVCEWIEYINEEYNHNRWRKFNQNSSELEVIKKGVEEDEDWNNFEFFLDFADYLRNYQLKGVGDLQRLSSYGLVKRDGKDQIVVIDFGLNDDTYDTFYRR